MVKRIGPEKANQYFTYFKGYFSSKLKKSDLDKLVILTIGKENIALHNQLLRAVLHNAVQSEVPPPYSASKPLKYIVRKPFSQHVPCNDAVSQIRARSNGDVFITSPKKERSANRDRKAKHRSSLLVPSKQGESASLQGLDNSAGNSTSIDLHRPLQGIRGAVEQSLADPKTGFIRSGKRPRSIVKSELPYMDNSKGGVDWCTVEAKELDAGEFDYPFQGTGPIRAPLGVPFCAGSVGSARKPPFFGLHGPVAQLLLVKGREEEFLDADDLPDTEALQRRMKYIATAEGLEGVNGDCADILNQGVDVFLKQLIKACMNVVRSKSGPQQESQGLKDNICPARDKDASRDTDSPALKLGKGLNGVCSGYHVQLTGNGTGGKVSKKEGEMTKTTVSLLDFKVAMELKPQELGEDWPLQFEKIAFRCLEQSGSGQYV